MSFTRKELTEAGVPEEALSAVMALRNKDLVNYVHADEAKASQEEAVKGITKERDKLQAKITDLESKAPDAAKVQAEFDAYKSQVDGEKANVQKATLFQQALVAAGVRIESAQKALLKTVDLSTVKLTADGKLDGVDALIAPLKTDYSDFFSTTQTDGVPATNPPTGGKLGTSKEQFSKMNVTVRAAIAAKDPQAYAALKGD